MNPTIIRDRLHEQINRLPDELVEEVADFILFLAAKRKISNRYHDWDDRQWHEFAAQQFFRAEDEDEIEYSLKDAREVYRP
ncbi:MAG: hypothetical protein DCC56_00825 [Anaerolineae bacterium]|nr:MAG: hypothetical protein DCC56_00825 [Anaerolineae bacterium]WKZ44577.1 MAG: DUF2281 domain-containing protein [Anaerolineales bacterium]